MVISKDDKLNFYFEGNQDQMKNNLQTIFENSDRQFEVIYETPILLKTTLISKIIDEQTSETIDILKSFFKNNI